MNQHHVEHNYNNDDNNFASTRRPVCSISNVFDIFFTRDNNYKNEENLLNVIMSKLIKGCAPDFAITKNLI